MINTRYVHPKEKPFQQDESTSAEPSSQWKTEGLAKMPLKVYNSQLAKLQPAEYQKNPWKTFNKYYNKSFSGSLRLINGRCSLWSL